MVEDQAREDGPPARGARPHRRGFTLIEMLVVISIIIFLMGFVVAAALNQGNRQRVKAAQATLRKISLALGKYYADFHLYPPVDNVAHTENLYTYLGEELPLGRNSPYAEFTEMEVKQVDSKLHLKDPWNNEVLYWALSQESAMRGAYKLYSAGPDGLPGTPDDVGLNDNE